MIEKGIVKKLNNEKGVAAVLVLAVILILTALGTIALVASVANVSVGVKSRVWTEDYYKLDSETESYVRKIDDCLGEAENNAREYVQNKFYETSTITTTLTDIGITPDVQQFFHDRFQSQLCTGSTIFTLEECIAHPTILGLGSSTSALLVKDEYTKRITEFNSETFNTVYFYIASLKLNALDTTYSAISLKTIGPSLDPCTTKYTGITVGSTWTEKQPSADDITVYIQVETSPGGDAKKVKAQLNVIVPDYEIVLQKMNMVYKGNPIWANAISAQGEIRVESNNAVIQGDVYDSGTGINILTGATVNIYGNVYSAGDVHVSGSNGRIHIYSHDTAGTSAPDNSYKKNIYDNGLGAAENGTDIYFDKAGENKRLKSYSATASALEIDNFIEGKTTIPLLFIDSTGWGNVYCRNLAIDEGVTSSAIKVDGNLWTSDDIEMDGKGSTIEIGQNISTSAIGLQADITENNPEASSSIINNYPESDGVNAASSIILHGNIVVPGIAFYDFDSGPAAATLNGHAYYKTPESVSAKVTSPTAIFNAYTTADTSVVPFVRDGSEYYMTTSSAISEDTLKTFINGKGLQTNIITGSTTPSGYVVKSSITQKDSSSSAVSYKSNEILNAGAVVQDYTILLNSGVMTDIFTAKTTRFGLEASYSGKVFSQYVNTSAAGSACPELLIYEDDSILDVTVVNEGVIYCKGNLTITGSGTFKGTIICEKNVAIQGDVTIVYDETVISLLHKNYEKVRSFFSPAAMGTDNYYEDYSTQSGKRNVMHVKRYKITSWKEQQG
jgi:cytoskeletal protein CcmA (bactofilin family)